MKHELTIPQVPEGTPKEKNTLLEQCIESFTAARNCIADSFESIWKVQQIQEWDGTGYTSFSDFCVNGLEISKSTGSQYAAIYDRYVREGGLSVKQLRQINPARLVKALKVAGSPQEQYSTALTWPISDFRAQKKDDCPGHEYASFCKHCWKAEPK